MTAVPGFSGICISFSSFSLLLQQIPCGGRFKLRGVGIVFTSRVRAEDPQPRFRWAIVVVGDAWFFSPSFRHFGPFPGKGAANPASCSEKTNQPGHFLVAKNAGNAGDAASSSPVLRQFRWRESQHSVIHRPGHVPAPDACDPVALRRTCDDACDSLRYCSRVVAGEQTSGSMSKKIRNQLIVGVWT